MTNIVDNNGKFEAENEFPLKHTQTPVRFQYFRFPECNSRNRFWHSNDPFKTHFFNSISLLLPLGEKFFVQCARQALGSITDRKLKEQTLAFITQEAAHGAQHRDFNLVLAAHGHHINGLEFWFKWRNKLAHRFLPLKDKMALIAAFEHFTAFMAHGVLTDPHWLKGADPGVTPIWRWHAAEEIEHKTVAFDIYHALGGGYLRRVLIMVLVSLLFCFDLFANQFILLLKDKQLRNIKSGLNGWKFLLLRPGVLRKLIPMYLDYYRPGFHPGNFDNRKLAIETLVRFSALKGH